MKRTRRLQAVAALAAIGLGGLVTGTLPARAQERGDAAKGLEYAQRTCAECHGVLENERVSPRFNVATFKRIADTPGMTGMALQVFFQTPHPNMPNLVVDEPDKSNVIAYITSLKSK